ncbi:GNAT family N-acetyltransferase [Paractinoplanes ferrugineus]|uniref:Acetyltransferase n=1 Tax=Paractinoplanes ferrugineus TaxID=113564 RepID=A0A919MBN5_9ACTN|nr:GNAT family N-acetyltransferase [Actinoplanes ferrugineus]GIE08614.1 acetyltransferase [Actinoplanes ferrugineus]
MPALISPTVDVHASYLRAMAEHVAEGRGRPGDGSNVGQYIRQFGRVWAEPAEFRRFVDGLLAQAAADTVRPATYVPTTTLWWVDGDEYLGRLGIRHRLAPGRMGERNGHIGYDVRPSARRKGHATAMLAASLPIAAALGLPKVLLTCDDTNEASRRTIERNGGVRHDRMDEKLRYWILTSPS